MANDMRSDNALRICTIVRQVALCCAVSPATHVAPGSTPECPVAIPAFAQGFVMRFCSRLISSCRALAVGVFTAALAAIAAHAQSASFSGVVLIDASEKPLVGAEILITSLNRSTRSDSAGNFIFAGLPAGRQRILVRFPGYESISADVQLTDGKPLEVDLSLRPLTTQLAAMEVKARSSIYASRLVDFDARRKMGIGKFLVEEEIAAENGRPLSSFIQKKIAGLRVLQLSGERFLASTRMAEASAMRGPSGPAGGNGKPFKNYPPGCYLQVIVNGRIEYNGSSGQEPFDVDRLNSLDIIGIEYYTTAQTPPQFNMTQGPEGKQCGTILLWTKGGG
ncbi:MAG: carboxypeptidase-like regulatory domain-containing protein [Gemmatimonas sp.]